MKPKLYILGAFGVCFYSYWVVGLAHHSIGADFNRDMYITVEAVIQDFRFVNPHPFATAKVVRGDGQQQEWTLLMDDLWELREFGFTPATFQPGDELVVIGFRSIREPSTVYVRRMERPSDDFVWLHEGEDETIIQRAVELPSSD